MKRIGKCLAVCLDMRRRRKEIYAILIDCLIYMLQ